MKRTLIIVTAVAGLLCGMQNALAAPVNDQVDGTHQGLKDGTKRVQWLQELNLSDEQKVKMKELRSKHHATMQSHKSSMKSAREDFKSAIDRNASDDELSQKFKTLHDLKSKMAELRFEQMLEIRGILTDEQKVNFKGFQHLMGKDGRRGDHDSKPGSQSDAVDGF